jgi:DNA repair exonuclease SbcCD ATPase subunit
MTIEKRADFLGLWNDACGSSQVLWTGSTLEAAAQEWRRLVAAGESDVSLTTYGRGEVASHHEMEWRYGTPKASFACPICGKETPHEHTGEAIAWHRDMEAWKQRDMEKRWERIEARIAELAALNAPDGVEGKRNG